MMKQGMFSRRGRDMEIGKQNEGTRNVFIYNFLDCLLNQKYGFRLNQIQTCCGDGSVIDDKTSIEFTACKPFPSLS